MQGTLAQESVLTRQDALVRPVWNGSAWWHERVGESRCCSVVIKVPHHHLTMVMYLRHLRTVQPTRLAGSGKITSNAAHDKIVSKRTIIHSHEVKM
jgi:hypothetical protein